MVAYNFESAYIAKKSVFLKSEFEFKLRSCTIYDSFTTIMKICFEYSKYYLPKYNLHKTYSDKDI